VESNWVHSALRPPIGLLCQSRVIMMKEKLVEWWLARETKALGENLPQCRFVHHKPHMLCPDANAGRRGGKLATNRLSYGTAKWTLKFIGNSLTNFLEPHSFQSSFTDIFLDLKYVHAVAVWRLTNALCQTLRVTTCSCEYMIYTYSQS
jgi:hypothetical protein